MTLLVLCVAIDLPVLPLLLSLTLPVVWYLDQVFLTPHSEIPNALAIWFTDSPFWKRSTICCLTPIAILLLLELTAGLEDGDKVVSNNSGDRFLHVPLPVLV